MFTKLFGRHYGSQALSVLSGAGVKIRGSHSSSLHCDLSLEFLHQMPFLTQLDSEF